jgi:hypothetical protein
MYCKDSKIYLGTEPYNKFDLSLAVVVVNAIILVFFIYYLCISKGLETK